MRVYYYFLGGALQLPGSLSLPPLSDLDIEKSRSMLHLDSSSLETLATNIHVRHFSMFRRNYTSILSQPRSQPRSQTRRDRRGVGSLKPHWQSLAWTITRHAFGA